MFAIHHVHSAFGYFCFLMYQRSQRLVLFDLRLCSQYTMVHSAFASAWPLMCQRAQHSVVSDLAIVRAVHQLAQFIRKRLAACVPSRASFRDNRSCAVFAIHQRARHIRRRLSSHVPTVVTMHQRAPCARAPYDRWSRGARAMWCSTPRQMAPCVDEL